MGGTLGPIHESLSAQRRAKPNDEMMLLPNMAAPTGVHLSAALTPREGDRSREAPLRQSVPSY